MDSEEDRHKTIYPHRSLCARNDDDDSISYEGESVYSVNRLGVKVVNENNSTLRTLIPWHMVTSFTAHTRDEIWTVIASLEVL